MTYGELGDRASRLAGLLKDEGAAKGDVVTLFLLNSPDFIVGLFGIQILGAVANPINTNLKSPEIEYMLNRSGTKILLTTSKFLPEMERVKHKITNLKSILLLDGNEEMSTQTPLTNQVGVDPGDPAFLLYTSGSTGRQKGVIHTQGGIRNVLVAGSKMLNVSQNENFLCTLPLFFAYGLFVNLLYPMMAGASLTITDGFSPRIFWETVSQQGCTFFAGVPTMFRALINIGKVEAATKSPLRICFSSGAPMHPDMAQEFEHTFGCRLFEFYGSTETLFSHTTYMTGLRKMNLIGKTLDYPSHEASIFDSDDKPLPPHEIGEIVLRSPFLMKGYVDEPEETLRVLRGGWFHTGDMGYMDEDGFFFIVERKDDMIKRGGERIFPKEVEDVICQHPKVLEAAVIGVPDEFWGSEVKAFVVPRPGEEVVDHGIIAFCKERLADSKCPKSVKFTKSLPKSPIGKTLRRFLRRADVNGTASDVQGRKL